MAEHRRVVFSAPSDVGRLPDWAGAAVFMIEWLQQRGLWRDIAARLKIQREGGYTGIDAFLFLLYFFGAELPGGLKEFSERTGKSQARLAAVGGRQRLPTQSSMSRILSAVEPELARDFGSWLLREVPGVIEVLRHPSVVTRDALGQGWHVFDWDPTVTVLRHRALPQIEGTPDGRRRSAALSKPGYPGRKRGDVQFSRATLQHAGSGLWLGIEVAPGNGALREAFESAVRQVVAVCEYAKLSRDHAILRSDGAAGNVPFVTTCIKGEIHYITRLAHYQLLQDEAVVGHLNEAPWYDVPSSGSGPRRQAADLGRVVLEPTPAKDPPSDTFEPVETRVVVSRYPTVGPGHGAGVTLDDWHYELYGTDLPPEGWPCPEIVAGYYGRSGQENRFCQEDRELGLDRIFSYHLPGQHLATVIGLFVWNFSLCRGMDFSSSPEELPEQEVALRPRVEEPPSLAVRPLSSDDLEQSGPGDASEDARGTEPAVPEPRPLDAASTSADEPESLTPLSRELIGLLASLDWTSILEKHDGFSWVAEQGALRCPAETILPLKRVETAVSGTKTRTVFKAAAGACDACDRRSACFSSEEPHYRRTIRVPLPAPRAEEALALWREVNVQQRRLALEATRQRRLASAPPRRRKAPHRRKERTPPRTIWRLKPLAWQPPLSPTTSPSFSVAPPLLLPAELRRLYRTTARRVEVRVRLGPLPSNPKQSHVLAGSAAERQRRRKSWSERLRWNGLPEASDIELRWLCDDEVRLLLAQAFPGSAECANAA